MCLNRTDLHSTGTSFQTYLEPYEPSTTDIVHEYLRVVDGLVERPAVADPNLLVLAGDVRVG